MHNLSIERWNGRSRGLGNAQTTTTAESIAATAATTTIGTLAALHATMFGLAFAGPMGIALTGLIGAAVAIASLFKGCGQTCIAATHIADQAGQIIDQAYYAYMGAPVHTQSMQQAYLQLFDGTMQAMDQACSDPALGIAGQKCISDRAQGSCAYKVSAGGWKQDANGNWTFVNYGANGSGDTCWNSYIGRRDPVANDPTVVPDPSSQITSASGVVDSVVAGLSPLMLGGFALLVFVLLSKGNR